MKNLSYWAKSHPLQARAIIIAIHTIAAVAAFKTGIWLYARHDVAWPVWFFPLLLTVTAWIKIQYPSKHSTETAFSADRRYWRSRQAMFGMTLCAWLLVLLAGNRTAQWSVQSSTSVGNTLERSPAAYGQMPLLMTDGGKMMYAKTAFKWLKIKKKTYFEKKVQRIRERASGNRSLDPAAQVLLTLLTLLVASFLALLIAGLACELSCSGQEGLALLVAFLGGGLLIWGLIATIIAIWRASDGEGSPAAPPGDPLPRRPPSKKL